MGKPGDGKKMQEALFGHDYMGDAQNTQSELEKLFRTAPLQPPDFADPQNQAAQATQLLNAQLRRGRSSTFLPDPPAAVGTKSFLGG